MLIYKYITLSMQLWKKILGGFEMNDKLIKMGILFGAAAAFGIVSIIVVATKGKSNYFISKKLKLGAVIIGLSGALSGCIIGQRVSCYVPPDSGIYIQNSTQTDQIELSGRILRLYDETEFSYRVVNEKNLNEVIASGEITPLDGVLDTKEEEFKIKLNKDVLNGRSRIIFYMTSLEASQKEFESYKFGDLIIVENGILVKDRAINYGVLKNGEIGDCLQVKITDKSKDSYSYIIVENNANSKIVKKGSANVELFEYSETYKYDVINLKNDGNYEDGSYRVFFYKESIEEIGDNYKDFNCINNGEIAFSITNDVMTRIY